MKYYRGFASSIQQQHISSPLSPLITSSVSVGVGSGAGEEDIHDQGKESISI